MAPFDWFYFVSYSISIWYINHFAKIRFRNSDSKRADPFTLIQNRINPGRSVDLCLNPDKDYSVYMIYMTFTSSCTLLFFLSTVNHIFWWVIVCIENNHSSVVIPSCHPDELVVRRWMGFDQFGLWTAIIGCYVPGLRLALWCFPEVNWLYSCTVIFTGVSGMILPRVQRILILLYREVPH